MSSLSHGDLLERIRSQTWFYEFELPDGTVTDCYLTENVRPIHTDRAAWLRNYLNHRHGSNQRALDVACHEAYYSLILSETFASVTGVDRHPPSIEKARLITEVLAPGKIALVEETVEAYSPEQPFDLVLAFGLLYHHENPIGLLRKLAALTTHTLLLETQVTPWDLQGQIEDGHFQNQREMKGMFALCPDYPMKAEGGTTDLAMIPSLSALRFLLSHFGFEHITVSEPMPGDYEQFQRRQRVMIAAEKPQT